MRHAALRDHLTRLHTRETFQADLEARVAAGSGCALLLCDLDHLKLINDTFGHLAGDEALRAVAASLRAHLPPGWEAYRLSGDEFAVLADVPCRALAAWGQQLLETLAARPDRPLRVSMGVADLEAAQQREARQRAGQPPDPQALFALADARLYAAKRQGKGRVVQDDTAPRPSGDEVTPRLLERDLSRAQALAFLQAALRRAGRLGVQAPPGGGLSAFLRELDLVAQSLGYQTLRVQADPVRARRQYGAWSTASLGGVPVAGLPGTLTAHLHPERPLAVLLDTPAYLDPHTRADLGRLLGRAQAVITGQSVPDPEGQTTLSLPPLSDGAILALAEAQAGQPLGEEARTWLARRVEGLPARLSPWLSALLLEARLRRQSVAALTQAPPDDWEAAVLRHLPQGTPPHLPYLYGRAGDMREATQLLRDHPLLTLTGPPGRGRTRLARQLLWEARGAYAGGTFEVRLEGGQAPDAVLARITQALVGQAAAPVDPHAVGRLLERRPTLLLLGGLDPSRFPAVALETLLALSPSTRIIVTALAPLGLPGEATLPLAPLPDAEVRAALAVQLPAGQEQEDGAALDRLTREVGGEPGTLEALLPLVRTFGLSGTAAHLHRGGPVLPGGTPWREFGTSERRVLAALSTFGGPFDLPWAEQVSEASPFLLTALLGHHVLQPVGGGLYRLPDTLLRQGQTHLQHYPGIRQRAQERALAHAQAIVSAHPDLSAAWFRHLDTQYPVLRSLLSGHLRPPLAPDPALLHLLLRLTPYRLARTSLYDAWEDLHTALHTQSGPPTRLSVGLHLALADTLQHLGQHAEAHRLTQRTHTQAEQLQDSGLLTHALLTEARILHRRSAYGQAVTLFAAAHRRAQATGAAPVLAVRALGGQARSEVYLGHLAAAQTHVQEALRQVEALDQPQLHADLLNTAAMAASERRDLAQAHALFEQALALHGSYGGLAGQTLNLTGMAWVALLRGEYDQSAYLSRRVLRQTQDAGQNWESANALVNLGHALIGLGDLHEARARYLEGAHLAAQCDAPSVLAEALGGLADVLAREHQSGSARTLLDLALARPGANSEVQRFFAPLRARLAGEQAAPLSPALLTLLDGLRVPLVEGAEGPQRGE
ncbi:hypothetical protein Dcar01_01637 [Deinococcus carri]|uniref:GGDEF domain-containing protein n=1 Tax=Deinococcus carri TaxID=1211323 RepID=A0ABP9W8Q3_9DEIO